MYQVLIVDDEPPFVRELSRLLQKSPGFSVAATAYGGAEALAYLQTAPVDLLITDVKMPGMNGIDLIREARALYPGLPCVIVSGYADFEYAQGAIKAGVCDYVLKPIDPRLFAQTLAEAQARIGARQAARRDALVDAAMGLAPSSPVAAVPCRGAVALTGWVGQASVLQAAPPDFAWQARALEAAFVESGACAEACAEGLGGRLWFVLLLSPAPDAPARILSHARERDQAWTFSFTPTAEHPKEIAPALRPCARAAEEAARLRGPVLCGAEEPLPPFDASDWLPRLKALAASATGEGFTDCLRGMAQALVARNARQAEALALLKRALELAALRLEAKRLPDESAFADLCSGAESFEGLCASLCDLLEDLFDRTAPRAKSAEEQMEKISRFVKSRLDGPITLSDACEHLHVSQPLVSRAVRQQTGQSFNEYVTGLRMERAMTLLRGEPPLIVRDIAQSVGYEDVHYFCRVFKAVTGVTPTEYRAQS